MTKNRYGFTNSNGNRGLDDQLLALEIRRLRRTIATPQEYRNKESLIKNQNELEEKLDVINNSISNLDSSLNNTIINIGNQTIEIATDSAQKMEIFQESIINDLSLNLNNISNTVKHLNSANSASAASNEILVNTIVDAIKQSDASNVLLINTIVDRLIDSQESITQSTAEMITNKIMSTNIDYNNRLINSFYTNLVTIFDNSIIKSIDTKLGTISTKLDEERNKIVENNSNFLKLLDNLDVENTTQAVIIEYIGNNVILPVYQTRLFELSNFYYKQFQIQVIIKLERLLLLFNNKDYITLTNEYTQSNQDQILNDIYSLDKSARSDFIDYNETICNSLQINVINSINENKLLSFITNISETYNIFQHYIDWAYKTINGLSNARYMYKDFKLLNDQLELAKIDSDILNTPEKLKEFIDNWNRTQNRSHALFETTVNFDLTNVKLKPQYEEYIKRHGVPVDFEFDMEKMAEIIYDLAQQGIMDISEIPNICSSNSEGSSSGEILSTETDTNTEPEITTYFVYISDNDPSYNNLKNVYYYPLFINESDALAAVDIDKSNYDLSIEDLSINTINSYTENDPIDPSGVTKYVFEHLNDIELWQPNSHAYRGVGLLNHPPIKLMYTHYTKYTLLEDIVNSCDTSGNTTSVNYYTFTSCNDTSNNDISCNNTSEEDTLTSYSIETCDNDTLSMYSM